MHILKYILYTLEVYWAVLSNKKDSYKYMSINL